jgi:hypothetical protein
MCQTPIDVQARQIVKNVLMSESPSTREIAVSIEANQSYMDYLDWLKDNIPPQDGSVTIEVDGKRIKFQSVENFSEWLAERIT